MPDTFKPSTGTMRSPKPGSATDPLWYKDAILYEVHVRAFFDSNNDGIGDFPGLMEKLDYVQDLGVTCLWLLPFFPSPLRDDGYDCADYMDVHPSYGTLDDFKAFLDAAHQRGLQVMIELVVNHTSDQHPWFQRARSSPPGSPERDFYVWSDTDDKYNDARIIFTDTEKSNWTWDPVAQAYFWHRFFSHQPDLNYDNPQVLEEILNVLRFWLDLGVDGIRIDAIPYLVEREGTSCENLPETHAVIKRIRKEIDEHYENRVILAEANQWPTDVLPYFGEGDGDECHMAFHFPLMPRIYMALRQEDRTPITEIMRETPDIPSSCQWGLFLRNHDELTLEMVTDDERDYMYLAYSADPRMRINIGIRRRLAPLVDNNHARIALLNSLLFSFPGTPIIYYGDEIGMGDNIYLGDRNGVRTPMQWNADRNAGFSRANPAKLYSPVVMDPVWGYEAVNVEAQQSDPSSLLSWVRNMIALRKLFRVFGRGTLRFLDTNNVKILAYVREWENERVLCVANLSRFSQPFSLDLSEFETMVPVEMLGYVEFPTITRQPYPLTLSPYGFLWLELQGTPASLQQVTTPLPDGLTLDTNAPWTSLLEGPNLDQLEGTLLPAFLPRQRWFGGKSRKITSARVADWTVMPNTAFVLALVTVHYESGEDETYTLPLGVLFGEPAAQLRDSQAIAVIATATTLSGDSAVVYDAMADAEMQKLLLDIITLQSKFPTALNGKIDGIPGVELASLYEAGTLLPPKRIGVEQSNTSVIYGDKLILKLFRKQQEGPNPDNEIGRFLSENTTFDAAPPFAGSIEYTPSSGATSTLAMLQGLVRNEGDGWTWTLEELARYFEHVALETIPPELYALDHSSKPSALSPMLTDLARQHAGLSIEAATTLGRRTAEMHIALATPTEDPAFGTEPLTKNDMDILSQTLTDNGSRAFTALREALPTLPDELTELAALVLSRRSKLLESLTQLPESTIHGGKSRIHGDYHLGQVLRVKSDFVLLDFEGEPARPLEERRTRQSPVKDIAGMLRSYNYASFAGLHSYISRRNESFKGLAPWALLWESAVTTAYLNEYRRVAGSLHTVQANDPAFTSLLRVYLVDKALYELLYELNNRPAWVRIPLNGLLLLSA